MCIGIYAWSSFCSTGLFGYFLPPSFGIRECLEKVTAFSEIFTSISQQDVRLYIVTGAYCEQLRVFRLGKRVRILRMRNLFHVSMLFRRHRTNSAKLTNGAAKAYRHESESLF